jgi:hypothetical protein
MRDVLFLPLNEEEELALAIDNVGAIGEKERDDLKVPYDIAAYYSLRVAMMELLSVGAIPLSIAIANFNGEEAWSLYEKGIRNVCHELDVEPLPIAGSSETNFSLMQSAVGFTLIGKVKKAEKRIGCTPASARLAVVGTPLVGFEVLEQGEKMIPLSLFQSLLKEPGVYEVVPVGSKGVRYEIGIMEGMNGCSFSYRQSALSLDKSAGPATCILISYNGDCESKIKDICRELFHPLTEREVAR